VQPVCLVKLVRYGSCLEAGAPNSPPSQRACSGLQQKRSDLRQFLNRKGQRWRCGVPPTCKYSSDQTAPLEFWSISHAAHPLQQGPPRITPHRHSYFEGISGLTSCKSGSGVIVPTIHRPANVAGVYKLGMNPAPVHFIQALRLSFVVFALA
jgi:hypothetical protein